MSFHRNIHNSELGLVPATRQLAKEAAVKRQASNPQTDAYSQRQRRLHAEDPDAYFENLRLTNEAKSAKYRVARGFAPKPEDAAVLKLEPERQKLRRTKMEMENDAVVEVHRVSARQIKRALRLRIEHLRMVTDT